MSEVEVRPVVRLPVWRGAEDVQPLLTREWLVTNGRGGYASATIAGVNTRRYHGLLVAALPSPLGRNVMLNQLWEELTTPGGRTVALGGREYGSSLELAGAAHLREFRLEAGLPVWRYAAEGWVIERRIVMPHEHNSTHLLYRVLETPAGEATLRLRPSVHFRGYESPVDSPLSDDYHCTVDGGRCEVSAGEPYPPLRLRTFGPAATFHETPEHQRELVFRVEAGRGYQSVGELWSPGEFEVRLQAGDTIGLVASVEQWESIDALQPEHALEAELKRRSALLDLAGATADLVVAELVLAADQFIITPTGRPEEAARAKAAGEEVRTVIAGYHWFTDWGRDTMISLEGLTLATGRYREAGYILRTFARYVRDGLIPNMFPDGSTEGLYHTADATLWFFHALQRYHAVTGDRRTMPELLPVMRDIADHHLRGTRFGIGVDPADGLLHQGQPGYQLTWMDAKVDSWVVTPRRGKAVEINALWYNALRLLADWEDEAGDPAAADRWRSHAGRTEASFNRRFWYEPGGYLYDVVDSEAGDDPALRPNQLLAISLDYPVLDAARWGPVLERVRAELLTPVGLRSLAPGHPDFKSRYDGDLRTRDAAYHQGTVWAWLIGPFLDAWLRVHPEDTAGASLMLQGLVEHLDEFGVGSIAEIFDAEESFTPRGCIAQAWSVAETLRCLRRVKTLEAGRSGTLPAGPALAVRGAPPPGGRAQARNQLAPGLQPPAVTGSVDS
jgi:predicted glycogen debranching enzyme